MFLLNTLSYSAEKSNNKLVGSQEVELGSNFLLELLPSIKNPEMAEDILKTLTTPLHVFHRLIDNLPEELQQKALSHYLEADYNNDITVERATEIGKRYKEMWQKHKAKQAKEDNSNALFSSKSVTDKIDKKAN